MDACITFICFCEVGIWLSKVTIHIDVQEGM